MRLADIENIWTVDLRAIPNIQVGRVYLERTKHVIGEMLSDPASANGAIVNGRFIRSAVAARVGCRAAAISRNPRIRRVIQDAERALSRSEGVGEAGDQKQTLRMRVAYLERAVMELRSTSIAQAREITALREGGERSRGSAGDG